MRQLVITSFILIVLSCTNTSPDTDQLIEQSIAELIDHSTISVLMNKSSNGKIPFLKSEQCKKKNCTDLFRPYQSQMKFYSHEDLFMRGIKKYVILEKIDISQEKVMFEALVAGSNLEKITISN